jgi:hypothetical protein
LNIPTSNKVLRWKLAIKEYDLDVQHIAGVKNIVANSFSRLVEATKVPIGDILAINESNDSKETDSMQYPLSQNSYDLIANVHNSLMWHRGVEATCRFLKDEGAAWRRMRKDVSKFIRQCPTCQKSSVSKVAYNVVGFRDYIYNI